MQERQGYYYLTDKYYHIIHTPHVPLFVLNNSTSFENSYPFYFYLARNNAAIRTTDTKLLADTQKQIFKHATTKDPSWVVKVIQEKQYLIEQREFERVGTGDGGIRGEGKN